MGGKPFLILLSLLLIPVTASATVYEFNDDGSVEAFRANDYLATTRHQKFSTKIIALNTKKLSKKRYDEIVALKAEKYGVDNQLIHAIIHAESSYDPNAVSIAGAGGLMQLMPKTAIQYGVSDRFSPEENIDGGTKYLKFLLDRYGGDIPLAIAAYNAGEGAVDKYGQIPPFPETQAYVEKVSMFLTKN